MKRQIGSFLRGLLQDTEGEVADAQKRYSLSDLKSRVKDAPALRSFYNALRQPGFGMIAEVKRKSPSQGAMPPENVERAPAAYAASRIVRAVSVLTNHKHFGMSIEDLSRIRAAVHQPVLRKDFIFCEFQVYEARAFGADAILLMANVLAADEMKRLFDLASELGMDVLFESHTREEIHSIPAGAKIYGINSRRFESSAPAVRFGLSRLLRKTGLATKDLSTEADAFDLIAELRALPPHIVKVAESGVRPATLKPVRDAGYDAVLVGTSLLVGPEPIESVLAQFEDALRDPRGVPSPSPALAKP